MDSGNGSNASVIRIDNYNPVDDPLKITNLDLEIIEPLRQSLKESKATISHVMLILMGSTRQELFPLMPGSDMHQMTLRSHDEDERDGINEKLSLLTPNGERITGRFSNFTNANGSSYESAHQTFNYMSDNDMGGINVVGALSGSSLSFKTFVGSYCGVWPLPVDSMEEADSQLYQPCLSHIFGLFNNSTEAVETAAGARDHTVDLLERKWRPVYLQSIGDDFDRQEQINRQIGFSETVVKATVEQDPDFDEEEINYFGYPERVIKPDLKRIIQEAQDQKQRLFLSHYTSMTHHPWKTPDDFHMVGYMCHSMLHDHYDFNAYLNAVRFQDAWVGEIMDLLEDTGIANETLIVLAGDHGQAFKEDTSVTGTFENGHISNFRVPIVFRHPQLPRVQVNANATFMSILPTILDLLINTGSLNERNIRTASDLVQDYEGQSMIRPYIAEKNGRRLWNWGIINSGGGMISVTSADAPWRLIMPLEKTLQYSFTDLQHDSLELDPLESWRIEDLSTAVQLRYGEGAAAWVVEAEKVTRWWVDERKQLWKYKST